MKTSALLSLVVALCMCSTVSSSALHLEKWFKSSAIKPQTVTGSEYLDSENKYQLNWTVSDDGTTISFEVVAETKGYVGFGISPSGAMTGADILIAGVDDEGNLYFKDYHGLRNGMPVEDAHADWEVTFGEESETHTTLRFQRKLNTCDEEDFTITDATMRLIYALGATDDINYHGDGASRGTKSVNFFSQGGDDDFDPTKYKTIDITVTSEMKAEHTSYWCTIHEMPLFTEKQHIVAFEPILNNTLAVAHTHHFIFHRCVAPDGEDPEEFFKPWLTHSHEGDFCYDQQNKEFPFASYCNRNMVYVWSKGGKRMVFPSTLGLPMPDVPGQKDYYALEIHYDNPGKLAGESFFTGGRIYYTDDLRDTEAGLMVVDHRTRAQLTIPPKSENYVVAGHCSGECTEKFLPEEGITVFNNLLHAHLTGRKLKLRHFRGEQELEWIDSDDYYDFDFQQNKQLTKERKIERGDHLTMECTFDTTKVEGEKAVIGGLSSHEEMCQGWFFYYPRIQFTECGSAQNVEKHFELLGVTNFTLGESDYAGGQGQYVVIEPESLAGSYLESVSTKVEWTDDFRAKFQEEKRYGEQEFTCRNGGAGAPVTGTVKYPENINNVYEPPNECQPGGGGGGESGSGTTQISSFFISFTLALTSSKIWA